MLFVCHPACTTCAKAREYLKKHGLSFQERDIRTENPTLSELTVWHRKSGLPLKRFFNTSGNKYRELALTAKLPGMSESEQLALLATDGMLVRRPILVSGDTVLVGFSEKTWDEKLGQHSPRDGQSGREHT